MTLYRVTFAAAVAVAASAPAAAQDANSDVRCFIASNMFAKAAKEEPAREVSKLSGFYYLGRVMSRVPKEGLSSALEAQTKTLTPANAGQIMMDCAKRMEQDGKDISAIGQQLDKQRAAAAK